MDTWQYFFHRLFHTSKFLYRHIHSWHHRLYVPYSYGALYNHPLEGILFDSLGGLVAHMASGMTTRQAVILFALSTMKTVDDHCGYSIPFDLLQLFSPNNADYHDIHHQIWGIKKNFSQPWFVHWDVSDFPSLAGRQTNSQSLVSFQYFLGTRMLRSETPSAKSAQSKKLDPEVEKPGDFSETSSESSHSETTSISPEKAL
jgi:hypothetical protein